MTSDCSDGIGVGNVRQLNDKVWREGGWMMCRIRTWRGEGGVYDKGLGSPTKWYKGGWKLGCGSAGHDGSICEEE